MYRKHIKRPIDLIVSLLAILIFLPVLLIVALLIKIKLGSPVIFKQKRPGKNEKLFTLYKFRTMTDKRYPNGDLLPDNERLTKFGKCLRYTSLDELPELFNILKGDMSLVGPRPLLVDYLPLYNTYQKHRHDERPGLSGLAQVNGRNAIGWDKKFDFDIEYINNITFLGDMKIIFQTLLKAFLKHDGINQNNAVTMELFKGNSLIGNNQEDIKIERIEQVKDKQFFKEVINA